MILYIGNKLVSKERNASGIDTLSTLLRSEGYKVRAVSRIQWKLGRLISMILNVVWFHRKISYVLIDTYSTKNFYYAYIISRLCSLFKLKYIPILRGGNLPDRMSRSPKMSHRIFANSYKNIAPSNYLKATTEKNGFHAEFIPNVIEIEKYEFHERGISVPRLLYVRAFASIYNPEMAIRVLAKILKEYPTAKLCMIGPVKDASFESCKNLVEEMEITDHVEFTGKLSKEEWHKKSRDYNIFINTTNIDNTPISVMEAMALGLPVVSTNVGGLPFLIENGKTGLLVNRNDVDQMFDSVIVLLNDDKLKNTIVQNAREIVTNFDWNTVSKLWNKILT